MAAFANGETPESAKMKGDHFVGSYYVQCENIIKEEMALLKAKPKKRIIAISLKWIKQSYRRCRK